MHENVAYRQRDDILWTSGRRHRADTAALPVATPGNCPRSIDSLAFAGLHGNEVSTSRGRRLPTVLEHADGEAMHDLLPIGEKSRHVPWGPAPRARLGLERDVPTRSRMVEHDFDLTARVHPSVIHRSRARPCPRLPARPEGG